MENTLISNNISSQTLPAPVQTKGLLNMPGQNNCFLNSAVQVIKIFYFFIFLLINLN